MSAQFDYTIEDLATYIRESISGNCDEPGYEYLKYISTLRDNDKKVVSFIAEKASEFIVRHISSITTKLIPIEDYVGGVYSFSRASDGNIEVNFIISNEDPQFQGKLDYWLGRVRKFDNLLNSYLQGNGVYKFERAEDGEVIAAELMTQYDLKELTKICENLEKIWRRGEFIENNLPFRIRNLLTAIDRKSARNLEKLKLFQEDVIVYLRAITITASALGDDCVTIKRKIPYSKG